MMMVKRDPDTGTFITIGNFRLPLSVTLLVFLVAQGLAIYGWGIRIEQSQAGAPKPEWAAQVELRVKSLELADQRFADLIAALDKQGTRTLPVVQAQLTNMDQRLNIIAGKIDTLQRQLGEHLLSNGRMNIPRDGDKP